MWATQEFASDGVSISSASFTPLVLILAEDLFNKPSAMAAGGTGGKTYSFKVVLLGEGCVGKTSLVLRYCENKFNDKHITTLQVSCLAQRLGAAADTRGCLFSAHQQRTKRRCCCAGRGVFVLLSPEGGRVLRSPNPNGRAGLWRNWGVAERPARPGCTRLQTKRTAMCQYWTNWKLV